VRKLKEADAPAPIRDRTRPITVHPARAVVAPLSFAQQRMWFLHQLDPDGSQYTIAVAFRVRGGLDVEALERSFNEIVRRHEALRTTFVVESGTPAQMIAPDWTGRMARVDLENLPEAERAQEANRIIAEDARRPFDLTRGPLIRARVAHLGAGDHVL